MNSVNEVPQEMQALRNFVVWNAPSKVPFNPNDTHAGAKANDPATWGSYEDALNAATLEGFSGIGFEFGGTDFVGIDFDGVLSDGKPEDYVIEILEQLGNPYCEISPSGTGLHAFVRCEKIPGTKRKFSNGKHYGAEIYSGREKGRYFTITGQRFSGAGVPKIDDIGIPYLLLSQIHDVKFKKLWMGDASDYGDDQSRADLALSWRLAQLLDHDRERVEQVFNASKPGQREKWVQRQEYRDWTLTKACANKKEPIEVRFETGFEEPEHAASKANLRVGKTIEPKRVKWLWENRVPLGKITLFAGNPDNGKSLAANSLAAHITTGENFPDSPNLIPPSDVLMLLGEDDLEDTAVPRLIAAKADMNRVQFLDSVIRSESTDSEVRLDVDLPAIELALRENPNIRLIVIDPISNYLGDVSMVAEQDIRRVVLMPLKRLAEQTQVAIVIIMHLNKKSELDAISRVGGAMAFTGVARCSWLFVRDAASEEGQAKDSFTMSRIKNNLVTAAHGGLAYHIEAAQIPVKNEPEPVWAPFVVWGGVVQQTADGALEGNRRRGRPKVEGGDSKIESAVQFLQQALKDGPQSGKELTEQAREVLDIHARTLRRAQEHLGIKPYKDGKVWKWKLSEVNATAESLGEETRQADGTPSLVAVDCR